VRQQAAEARNSPKLLVPCLEVVEHREHRTGIAQQLCRQRVGPNLSTVRGPGTVVHPGADQQHAREREPEIQRRASAMGRIKPRPIMPVSHAAKPTAPISVDSSENPKCRQVSGLKYLRELVRDLPAQRV